MTLLACAALSVALITGYGGQHPAEGQPPGASGAQPDAAANAISSARDLLSQRKFAEAEEKLQNAQLYALPASENEKEINKLLEISLTGRASSLIKEAGDFLTQRDYLKAEEKSRAAFEIAPSGSPVSKKAETILQGVLTINKHRVLLDEARKLIAEYKFEDASKLVQQVLNESKEIAVNNDAKTLLAQAHPGFSSKLWDIQEHYKSLEWLLLDLFLSGLALYALYRFIKGRRDRWARQNCCKWIVLAIDDTTNMGMSEVIIDSFRRLGAGRSSVSMGLLKLETLQLPTMPQLELPRPDIDLTPALEAIPLQFQGISLAAIAKARVPFRNWYNATRPWIKGTAFLVDSQVVVRLTCRNSNGKTKTVFASAEKGMSNTAAEAASYKMYYLIAKESTAKDADIAVLLDDGLKLLGQYVSGRNHENLRKAYEAFRDVRSENPAFDEAYLYEGIALDLLERHNEASNLFQYLADNASNQTLKEKALYNRAISLFRKYERETSEEVIKLLEQLVGKSGAWYQLPKDANGEKVKTDPLPDSWNKEVVNLAAYPIKALALAAEANAIALRPIFWQQYFQVPKTADKDTVRQMKTDNRETVMEWVSDVEDIAALLKKVLEHAEKMSTWDNRTLRQLKWARQNALGNMYLDCAKYFLIEPYVNEQEDRKLREEYLKKALEAFRECEVLLPPGVETLSNMGTLLSELGQEEEARTYLDNAISLNKDYEYAYYRKAESWDKEKQRDKVVETLRSFRKVKTPHIRSFIKLYQDYAIDLAQR